MIAKILTMLLGLILVLAVACGSAAEPTAVPDPTPLPGQSAETAPAAEPTAAPVVGEAPQSQPTPIPELTDPPAPAEVEVNPGKLIIMMGDLASERFDYTFVGGQAAANNYSRILGGFLLSDNEKKDMVPGIASQWGLSADGLTWTFTIRKGVKFHDGSEVTAEDALWTLQHSFGPQAFEYAEAASARRSRGMDRMELSGPDNVNVITKIPFTDLALFVSEAAGTWYPIMPKRATLHDETEELAYDANPIGAGPMRLVGHTPAQVMKFERFDDFYYQPGNGFPEDKQVKFQSLDLYLVPEEATRVAALRSGEADMVPASLATKEQVEASGGRLIFGQEGVVVDPRLLGCYESKYPCHDKRVRQALNYAIDKELIRDTLFGGLQVFQVKGWTSITPSTIGYTPELDPWPQDVAKARQLLADAGYPGGKGIGKLILNTSASSSMPLQIETVQLAAEFWKRELGLDVEIRVGETAALRERQIAGELNGQILWQENEARKDATSGITSNWGDPTSERRLHEDPELYRLVQETVQILDSDKRAEAYKKMYLRLRDESYNIGIGYVNIPWGLGPRVLTWEPYPLSQWPSALHTITLK